MKWFSELLERKLRFKSKNWLDKKGVENYTYRQDGTVDVDGSVDLSHKNLTKIPVKFGKVSGWFDCSCNQLTSLEGCPREVGRSFDCSCNQLTSLEGCPNKVEWNFYCSENPKQFTKEEVQKYLKVKRRNT